MIKKLDLHDYQLLFELLNHPDVYPFVRHTATSAEEYLFTMKHLIDEEANGVLISRTILDEWHRPIGSISLFDIEEKMGFLATWIGKDYHGKGYNQKAKEAFLEELFMEHNMETVFLKIRKVNLRSKYAAEKLSYTFLANDIYPHIYKKINQVGEIYDLYEIPKFSFMSYLYNLEKEEIDEQTL